MKINLLYQKLITEFAPKMGGAFTLSDLRATLSSPSPVAFYRELRSLIRAQVLKRFSREIYITENHDLRTVSQKLCPESYISFGNVLAQENIIGTVPREHITAVKVGKKRIYKCPPETIIHLGISKHLYFGMKTIDGVQYALPEKAFLDTLYFHQKGYKFYFDVYSDINIAKLNLILVKEFLKKYKNPKFVSFVSGYISHV